MFLRELRISVIIAGKKNPNHKATIVDFSPPFPLPPWFPFPKVFDFLFALLVYLSLHQAMNSRSLAKRSEKYLMFKIAAKLS